MRHLMRITAAAGLALALLAPALTPTLALAQVNSVRGPVQKPVPMQILDKPAPDADQKDAGQDAGQARGKFKNIDTAKNRRDYEMGTDAPGITIGRDEDSGDSVVSHTPPKQKPQQNPFAGQPIEVKPIIIPK